MIKWLLKKYRDNKMKNHISKQRCFVFPILPKECLIDGKDYETFVFKKIRYGYDGWYYKIDIDYAKWNKEKDCFIDVFRVIDYDDFKPIRESVEMKSTVDYDILSYNPCTVNELDLEELRKITFEIGDDTTIESDDIWDKLIDYFDKRGLSE